MLSTGSSVQLCAEALSLHPELLLFVLSVYFSPYFVSNIHAKVATDWQHSVTPYKHNTRCRTICWCHHRLELTCDWTHCSVSRSPNSALHSQVSTNTCSPTHRCKSTLTTRMLAINMSIHYQNLCSSDSN